MSKAIKPLIVILFLLTAFALYLGIELFGQREKIKSRVVTLEKSAVQVANNIRYEGLNANSLKDHTMTANQLKPLEVAANLQYEELVDTKDVLKTTEEELGQTKETLASTERELEEKKTEIVQLNDDIQAKDNQIATLESDVSTLETEKTEMAGKIDALNEEIVAKENELIDAQAEYASLQEAYDEAVKDFYDSQRADGSVLTPSDLAGQILSVNAEWNFVILDIGSEQGLKANAEMLVHRSKDLVGKVRVSDVKDEMAVAEILNDWEQLPIRAGDAVISPQS